MSSILGLSGLGLNPYLYTDSSQLGLTGLTGLTGLSSLTGLSGLGNTSMVSFASILQKALESLPVCGCQGTSVQTAESTAQNSTAVKQKDTSNIYADTLKNNQNYLEQYRSSLRNSLIQSGRISSQSSLSRQSGLRSSAYVQRPSVKHVLDWST